MPKKGDITKCEHYRTISLINHNHSSKIFQNLIQSWMKPYVEAILAVEHAGFWLERSTVEQVFALKMLIQHRIEMKDGEVFAVFIDYKKAFDRVWHDGLFSVLQQYGVPRKRFNIIRDLYYFCGSCNPYFKYLPPNLGVWFAPNYSQHIILETCSLNQLCLHSPSVIRWFKT